MHRLLCILSWLLALVVTANVIAAQTPPRMLIFSKTAGFRHASIPAAVATMQRLATEEGLAVDQTENASDFNPSNLARYRVVVFASTTGDVLDAAQQNAMEGFVRHGGGFLGIHAAADAEYDWPWYGQLVGAYFHSHPAGLQSTRITPEPKGSPWSIRDELYNYRSNPRGHVRIVATLDESLYQGGTMGKDHPIAWCHAFEGGRAWYTGLGHDPAVYTDANFLNMLRRGLRYVAGRSDDC